MKASPLVWIVLGAVLGWLGLRRFERFMIFHPSRAIDVHPGTAGLAWEPLWLTAEDGVKIRAWRIPGPRPDSTVMLCLHGNGGNLSSRVDKMKLFHEAGASQLWLDWRGYGESSGSPDEEGLYRDARAGYARLAAEGVPSSRLVVYGESLGSGPAVELASRAPAAGLVVDSGFTSITDMTKVVLPWFPTSLETIRFDNLSKLPRVKVPTLFLHSPDDDIVPYAQGRLNFAAAGGPKTFVDLKGAHNDGFLEIGPAYVAAVRRFLASLPR